VPVSSPVTLGYKFPMVDSLVKAPKGRRDRRQRVAVVLLGLGFEVASHGACAQQTTTATYEDWTVRCTTSAGSPPQKLCEMEQVSLLQNKQPFSRVAISHPEKGKPTALAVQVPVNVWIATGVRIEIGGKDAGMSAPFTRCGPAGCFAEIGLTDNAQKRFRSGAEPAQILYKNVAQQDVTIPLSFKGFGQAFDALAKD
jgi:invasion protein IalB